jgi:myo-inositol 2-dehydrogenase / D-chiro-inositol 1-dehydrogenase
MSARPEEERMRIGLVGVGRIGALHAATLAGLPAVDELIIADADAARAKEIAGPLGARVADTAEDLFSAGIDALVVASPTLTHPDLIRRGVAANVPVFCEKPVAPDAAGTVGVIEATAGSSVPVQIGFQRRFDPGFAAARHAAMTGTLGWLHTIRSTTFDPAPPPAGYIAGSGGIFRDCAVHDFDSIRWATGREVTQVFATGSNRGEDFFRDAGDVDSASAVLTLDDATIALVSCTRYNAAGYDVRLELFGSRSSVVAGMNGRTPLLSTEPGAGTTQDRAYRQFTDRFRDAYVAELSAFTKVAAGKGPSPCTPADALEAFYVAEACELSRRRHAPVAIAEVRG